MLTRCKVTCNYIHQSDVNGSHLIFTPVVDGSEENKQFFKYTPGGQIQFYVTNEAVASRFEMGKQYYVDFSQAE